MAIYKVQGPNGEIITIEGPENANPNDVIAQAQSLYKPKEEKSAMAKFAEPFKDVSLKDWAQKSLLAPALQTMQSVSPFGILRPDVAAMNLKQGSQNLGGKVGQMAQGAYNVATNPVEAAQKAYTAVTENPAGVAGEMAKGLLYDPEMLIGSGLGTVAERAAAGTYNAGKATLGGAADIVGGAVGRGTGYIAKPGVTPVGYQIPSQRAPLRNTVMLPEDVARFERGEMPYGQMPTEVPIQQLPRNAVERTALKMSGGEIPYRGQAARAFGERLGETYRNPITAAVDIGSIFATGGIPVLTAGRGLLAGVQGAADAILARRGLDPNLPTRLAEYQSGARPMPGTPPAPVPVPGAVNPATMSYPLTVQGPGQQLPPSVMTAPDLSRKVNIEGQQFNLPSNINVANSQTARPQPVSQTPAQQSQQMAAQKLQQVQQTPQVDPAMLAKQQAMQEQIRQRALQQRNPPPEGGEPVVNTPQPKPAPTGGGSMFESLPGQRWTPEEKLLLERQALQENPPPATTITPEDIAQQKQAAAQSASQYRGEVVREWVKGNNMVEGVPLDTSKNAYNGSNRTRAQAEKLMKAGIDSIPKLEGVTEAQTINAMVEHLEKTNPNIFKGKKKGPKNVSQMIIDDGSSTWNSMKLPDNASPVERRIALMSQAERDRLQSNLQQSLDPNNPMHKEYLDMFKKYSIK